MEEHIPDVNPGGFSVLGVKEGIGQSFVGRVLAHVSSEVVDELVALIVGVSMLVKLSDGLSSLGDFICYN